MMDSIPDKVGLRYPSRGQAPVVSALRAKCYLKPMSTIHKKIWREYFEKIVSGQKKLELRLADIEVNEGDTLKEALIERPGVGVGVMIFKNAKILLGKRKGSHGEGEYAFPGGHLEYMESFADCARREVSEECGIEIDNIRFQYLANITKYAPKHYTHIGLMADWKSGEPRVLEPDKSESWSWYDIDNLPQPMFEMCALAVRCQKTGINYLDVSDLK